MKRVHLFLTVALIALIGASAQATVQMTENFDSDPGWTTTGPMAAGFSNTDNTGGASPAGEAGGFVTSGGTSRIAYSDVFGQTVTLADYLYTSGELVVTGNGGDGLDQSGQPVASGANTGDRAQSLPQVKRQGQVPNGA
jgi:hypothetical protein